ncbi:hypothetical protein GF354_05705 [Candidatus Peregrinibacteria bacterium]|nr:hypothetical protein [Candidatus Peregrinibacteria bacterium]
MEEKNHQKSENFEEVLKNLNKPQISRSSKVRIKNSLFASINADRNITSFIQKTAFGVHLDSIRRAIIKEKIFEIIEGSSQKNYFLQRFLKFNKKFISSALVMFMCFTMFSFISVDLRVARAETLTKLKSFEGNVNVIRNGEVLEAYPDMELTELDKIVTGRTAEAEIEYFDDSVSRLSSNTELSINQLSKGDINAVKSYVEISVDEGRVWSKVINIVDESSYFAVKAKDVSMRTRKAAFNVENDQNEVKVEVFNHAVEVESSKVNTEKIVSGQKVSLSSKSAFKVENLDVNENDDEWVEENLREDLAHLEEIENRDVAKKKESLEDSSLKEDALLLITFNDVKEKQLELDIAEKKFVAAELKLRNPELSEDEREDLEEELADFSGKISDYYLFVEEIAERDDEYAEELMVYAEEIILARKKDLSVVLPDSPVYVAKEVIDDIQLSTVKTDSELVEKKVEKALDKLADAESLVQKGESELAATVIDDTEKDLDEVKEIADNEEADEDIEEMVQDAYNVKESLSEKLLIADEQDDMSEAITTTSITNTATQFDEELVSESVTTTQKDESEQVELKYGVEIVGDKALSPMLSDF